MVAVVIVMTLALGGAECNTFNLNMSEKNNVKSGVY